MFDKEVSRVLGTGLETGFVVYIVILGEVFIFYKEEKVPCTPTTIKVQITVIVGVGINIKTLPDPNLNLGLELGLVVRVS